jgi:hypothetical protein
MADQNQTPNAGAPGPITRPDQKAAKVRPSREESEKQQAELHAKIAKERKDLVDKTHAFIDENFSDMDGRTRDEILHEIFDAVRSVKTVAANAKLRFPRSAIQAEEKLTMPRLTPPSQKGDAPNRNIMKQTDQNETELLGGKETK